jgi:hypothetical protein
MMAETLPEKIRRLRSERNKKRREASGHRTRLQQLNRRIRKVNAALRRLVSGGVPPMNPGGWHPDAVENQTITPLSWTAGRPKLVWHTTEGSGLPSYSNSQPHFTLNPKTGALWQHVPIRGGAYTLRNPSGGVETNRARAIQVELIGFARESHLWSDEAYRNIAKLARWIEKHAGVPRQCTVTFRSDSNHKVPDYTNYTGHLGHQHVPENDHWDPGLFQIRKVV